MSTSGLKITAPRLTKSSIVGAAARLSKQYEDIVGREYIARNGLHFLDFYEKVLYPRFKIDFYVDCDLGADADGNRLLGRYDVEANAAYLDISMSCELGDPRRIFTCWHEVAGHGALQGAWLQKQLQRTEQFKSIDVTARSISPYAERQLEWQANVFAAHVAAPDWLVRYAVRTIIAPGRKLPFYGPCWYCLSAEGLQDRRYLVDFGELCAWVGRKVSRLFGGLSAEAIGYRVADLGLVENLTTPDLRSDRASRCASPIGSSLTLDRRSAGPLHSRN